MTIKGSGKLLSPLDGLTLKATVFRSIKMITHTASNTSSRLSWEKLSQSVFQPQCFLKIWGGKKAHLMFYGNTICFCLSKANVYLQFKYSVHVRTFSEEDKGGKMAAADSVQQRRQYRRQNQQSSSGTDDTNFLKLHCSLLLHKVVKCKFWWKLFVMCTAVLLWNWF